jgi:Na+/H+-dicarboxylate symporter
MGGRTFGVLLVMLVAATTFAIGVGPVAVSHLNIDPQSADALRAASAASNAAPADATIETVRKAAGLRQWLVDLVPSNPIKAAADGGMLQVIVFTVFFGLAISRISTTARHGLLSAVTGLYEATLTLVGWVLDLAPIGVFAITVPLAAKLGVAAAGAVAFYVGTVSAMTACFALLFYLAAALFGRQSVRLFARACAPAQAVALSSRSSMASLPALLDGAANVLGLRPAARAFVVPLAVSTFRPAGAIAIPMGVLFLARLYGVPLDARQLLTIAATSVLTTFSAPGIPSGSILVILPVLVSVGIPVGAIGLLLAADTIPDMIRTVTNVTGDMAVATIIARFERTGEAPEPALEPRIV